MSYDLANVLDLRSIPQNRDWKPQVTVFSISEIENTNCRFQLRVFCLFCKLRIGIGRRRGNQSMATIRSVVRSEIWENRKRKQETKLRPQFRELRSAISEFGGLNCQFPISILSQADFLWPYIRTIHTLLLCKLLIHKNNSHISIM